MKRARDSAGFTLIELMIVIAVIGVLATVTVPKYQAVTDQYRLESSADDVLVRLRQAKQLAMDERKNVGIQVNNNQVQLVSVDPDNGQLTALEDSQNFDLGIELDPTTSSALWTNVSGQTYLYFDYRGFLKTESAGVTAIISLKSNRSSRHVNVNIEAETAHIFVSWP